MDGPPPAYEPASANFKRTSTQSHHPARQESGIPAQARRSMEDQNRPLPRGWIRQWDPTSHHNFYVDTNTTPSRSIWSHPLDDEQYRTEHPEEAKELSARQYDEHHAPYHPDETSSEEGGEENGHARYSASSSSSSSKPPPTGLKKMGQSMKNKMTNSTHAERVAKREKQREMERKAYEQHQAMRAAMVRASQTGEPQLIGKDRQGREIFAQPPPPNAPYAGAAIGYGPYQTAPAYPYGGGAYPAPYGPYNRGMGMGYGGGMGLPIMGGLAGGMLLGGLLF